ncbi:MAG: aldehyde ferredoxin oxidoreductase [Bacteroidia bacterium]|nr:MAG: aldehyde ferredoxin oxidoreductase [Bacteroidia bacterium]
MEEITGLSNRVIEINLTDRSWKSIDIPEEDTRLYMGGKGMVNKMLYDRLKPGCDPLGTENIFALHTGAFMGTGAPCSGRFSAGAKSPLTGIMTTSSCGGPFGMALKTSGWDGMILTGKAESLLWISISSAGAEFNDATGLSGLDTAEVQKELENEGSGVMAIGQAGENMVRIANIISGHRFLGRAGLGAVMGSKNVKAITAKGKEYKIVPADPETFKKIRTEFMKDSAANNFTGRLYRNYGTNSYVRLSQDHGMLPVNNFSDGSHPDFDKISGETFEKEYVTGHSTCKPCIIMCGHKGRFAGRDMQVPEYESTGLLGPNLGIFDPEPIARWNDICRSMGFDTITAGSALGWSMEAAEKGLYNTELRFGSTENIDSTLVNIGKGTGEGSELGNGIRWLSEKYGGAEFAIHSKGLEAAAYDPRGSTGYGLALATANRGACHLESSMMAIQAFEGFSYKHVRIGVAFQVLWFENMFSAINNLQTCQFTSNSVVGERRIVKILPKSIIRIFNVLVPWHSLGLISLSQYHALWSSITGIKLNRSDFLKSGARTHILERYINTREGISAKDDKLPYRFTSESRKSDPKNRKIWLYPMLIKYYWYRGYDKKGIPSPKTLGKFGIKTNHLSENKTIY